MTDYIEREAAVNALVKIINDYDMPKDWRNGMSAAMSALYRVTAADVRPVVRGKWEEKEKDGVWWYACSVCGEHIPKGRWGQEWHSNFCPNCGARMEES